MKTKVTPNHITPLNRMEIRRVLEFDGGNHLVSNVFQFRSAKGEQWQDVPVIKKHEATLHDMDEGITTPEILGREYGQISVDYHAKRLADYRKSKRT